MERAPEYVETWKGFAFVHEGIDLEGRMLALVLSFTWLPTHGTASANLQDPISVAGWSHLAKSADAFADT